MSYASNMDTTRMDATLDLLTPEAFADALRFVEVWEQTGHMAQEEAEEWRRRILAWERFLHSCSEGSQ